MKTRKSIMVWAAFAVCAALVLAAMAWLTRGVLDAEHHRARAEAEREVAEIRADIEERTRLALWRMDAAGAAVMLRENRAASDATAPPADAGEVWLRFTARPDPPDFDFLGASDDRITQFRDRLAAATSFASAWAVLDDAVARVPVPEEPPPAPEAPTTQVRIDELKQIQSNAIERSQRVRILDQQFDAYNIAPQNIPAPSATPMQAAWVADELLLLRKLNTPPSIQGVWIDWRELAATLLGEIQDLLPNAQLVPAIEAGLTADPLTLASFPLHLVRNEMAATATPATVTLDTPLRIAWATVLGALIAAALLAAGIMRLSERRASFVSAVTHELRTPLTTFRLYSDLLEKDAVHGEKRARYLRTLTREADRLTHLVENVLAFSRIENRPPRANHRETAAAAWIAEIRPRLEDRLATAGLALEALLDGPAAATPLRIDTAAAEHILFNLIDNAAKYAAGSTPPVVRLEVVESAGRIEIRVRDHGPGIPEHDRRRIFKPFHKSDLAAAETRPGVGLGLALSHRLAKSFGARLEIRPADPGACFVLVMPPA